MESSCTLLDELHRRAELLKKDQEVAYDLWKTADVLDPEPRKELLASLLSVREAQGECALAIDKHHAECSACRPGC